MNVAVYTLTRERLDYTRVCFKALQEKAGYQFDHFVVDNGSKDGTAEWLLSEYKPKKALMLPENVGISFGSNHARRLIFESSSSYDLIIKMDNDCMVQTDGIISHLVAIYKNHLPDPNRWALGPKVIGLSRTPSATEPRTYGPYHLRMRAVLGGIFRAVPRPMYEAFPGYSTTLPKAWGQDDTFCEWIRSSKRLKAQVDELAVEHFETTDGQAKRYPQYFERKWAEEKA